LKRLKLLRKIYGNSIVLATAFRRRGIAYGDREKIERLRDRRVRKLVSYAASSVPYYREWFREHGVNPNEIRTATDLTQLPVLEKATVIRNPEQFRSESRRGLGAIEFNTSGSTGSPLTFYHDRRSILANMAFGEPGRSVKTDLIGRQFGYRTLGISRSASTISKVRAFCSDHTLVPMRPRSKRLNITDPPEKVIETIRQLKPAIISGYGSYLELLFTYIHERNIEIPLPQLVRYSADGMTGPGRKLINEQFGLPVAASYSAVECFRIGFQCGQGPAYHLHEDLCHVRIAGEGGETLPTGEKGSVIINNLVNRGTVLLNYKLGDIASLSDEPCACGRTLRLLADLEGRAEDMLTLADGRFLHPRAIWAVLRNTEGLLRYQLVQHEPERFELKLMTSDEDAYTRIMKQVSLELQSLLGDTALVEIRRHETLLPERSGKFRPVISKCSRRNNS
jgi:phenylacetate-CoA ligase